MSMPVVHDVLMASVVHGKAVAAVKRMTGAGTALPLGATLSLRSTPVLMAVYGVRLGAYADL